MAGDEAKVKMSGDGQQLMATLASVQKGFDSLTKSLDAQEEKSRKVGKETKAVYDDMAKGQNTAIAGAAKIAASYISVAGAIKLMSVDYDKLMQKMQNSATVGATFGTSMIAASKNTSIPQQQLEDIVKRVAQNTGTRPTFLAGQAAGVLAAGGPSMTPERFESVLMAAAPAAGMNAEDFGAKARTVAGYRAAAGDKARLNDQQVVGYIGAAAGGSFIDSEAQYSPIAMNTIAAASANKINEGQALGFLNAVTKATFDDTGLSSRTAGIKGMSAFGKATADLGISGDDLKPLIDKLRADPQARAKFMENAAFETQNRDAIAQMFVPGSNQARILDEAMANAPTMAQGEANYRDQIARTRSSSTTRSMIAGEALAGSAELLALDPRQMRAGMLRENIKKVRENSSTSGTLDFLDEKRLDALFATGADPDEAVAGEIRGRINALNMPRSGKYGGAAAGFKHDPANGDDSQRARQTEILQQMLDVLIENKNQNDRILNGTAQPAANGDRPTNPAKPMGVR